MIRRRDGDGGEVTDRRNGSADDPRGSAPSDTRVAIMIIGGIVVMFLIGFLLLVFAMASDWK